MNAGGQAAGRGGELGGGSDRLQWEKPDTDSLDLAGVMGYIRARCPWAAAHSHTSLQKYLLEETHELIAALDEHDREPGADTREQVIAELGDVLYQVLFHAALLDSADAGCGAGELRAEPAAPAAMTEVARRLGAKLIRRHPHVFDSTGPVDLAEVERRYEAVKAEERGGTDSADRDRADSKGGDRVAQARASFASVPLTMPALARAQSVLGRIDRLELTLPDPGTTGGDHDDAAAHRTTAIGRALFALAARAHAAGIDAEAALRAATSEVEDAAARAAEASGNAGGTSERDTGERRNA